MAGKQNLPPLGEAAPMAAEAFQAFGDAITEATERSRAVMEAGLEAWTREAQRYQDEFSEQGAVALQQLRACTSPLEVLGVEQSWLAARQKSYLDAGLRMAQAFATIAQSLKEREPSPPPHLA
jgi:hypothetical protein